MRATKETVMSRREVHLVVSNDADIEKIVTSLRDKFKSGLRRARPLHRRAHLYCARR